MCVFKYESVIHEFDPYFNYRVTQFTGFEYSRMCNFTCWMIFCSFIVLVIVVLSEIILIIIIYILCINLSISLDH
ncbi:putative dolichyl-diphosphooligosaccharide--protein glycotransferase [Helianthus anomalus]